MHIYISDICICSDSLSDMTVKIQIKRFMVSFVNCLSLDEYVRVYTLDNQERLL